MGWIDILVLALLGLAVFLGFRKGLVQEIVGIVALIVAFIAAVMLHQAAADLLISVFPKIPPMAAPTIGYAVVFAAAFAAITIAGWLLGRLVKASPLDFADKLGGMIVGLLKGALVLSILLLVLQSLPPEAKRTINRSMVARVIGTVAPWVFQKSRSLWPAVKENIQKVQDAPAPQSIEELKGKAGQLMQGFKYAPQPAKPDTAKTVKRKPK